MVYKRPASIEITSQIYSERYGDEKTARSRLFNIGAGAWQHPGWTNIDLPAQTEAFARIQAPFIAHNLVEEAALPIADQSADGIYCSHVVEHIPESAVLNLMQESFRVLDTGGVLRISTGPCADLDWDAMIRNDENWWYWFRDTDFLASIDKNLPEMSIHDYWLFSVATPRSYYSPTPCERKFATQEIVDLVKTYEDRPDQLLDLLTASLPFDAQSAGNHISWWNFDKLNAFLKQAGFSNIRRSGYGQSTCDLMRDLRYFDQTYPQISVYIEAIKS